MGADEQGVTRVSMIFPGHVGVVDVPDDQVERYTAQGWKKVRASRRADTGAIPTQQTQR